MNIDIYSVGVLETNCIVISDDGYTHCIIIDPGARSRQLESLIKDNKVKVDGILVTHRHFDHVGGIAHYRKKYDTAVYMYKPEYEDMKRKHREDHLLFAVDHWIESDRELDFGYTVLQPLLLPGHTNYSLCYYDKNEKLVISGDTLFYHSIGTESYYNGPATDLSDNIRKVLFELPEDTIVYPGHRQTTTIGEEKTKNPYLSDADTVDPWL